MYVRVKYNKKILYKAKISISFGTLLEFLSRKPHLKAESFLGNRLIAFKYKSIEEFLKRHLYTKFLHQRGDSLERIHFKINICYFLRTLGRIEQI